MVMLTVVMITIAVTMIVSKTRWNDNYSGDDSVTTRTAMVILNKAMENENLEKYVTIIYVNGNEIEIR